MRKKSTRLLSAALAVCMMLSVLPVGAFAAEPGAAEPENGASAQAEEEFVQPESVEINSTNFQDTDFQNYVKQYDKDGNDSGIERREACEHEADQADERKNQVSLLLEDDLHVRNIFLGNARKTQPFCFKMNGKKQADIVQERRRHRSQ